MSESNYIPSESFLLALVGICSGICGGFLSFILKSRCSEIECCCIKIKRAVLSADELEKGNISLENNNNQI